MTSNIFLRRFSASWLGRNSTSQKTLILTFSDNDMVIEITFFTTDIVKSKPKNEPILVLE